MTAIATQGRSKPGDGASPEPHSRVIDLNNRATMAVVLKWQGQIFGDAPVLHTGGAAVVYEPIGNTCLGTPDKKLKILRI